MIGILPVHKHDRSYYYSDKEYIKEQNPQQLPYILLPISTFDFFFLTVLLMT